jgi:thiaminase/transcriptional activator TenA
MSDALHKRLWRQNQELATACLNHPFVSGLADGSLSQEAFKSYIAQDAFFLTAFARGYALCAARCEQIADFRIFFELQGGVLDELETHAAFAASLSIDLVNVTPFPETKAYTDFLLQTGQSSSLGSTLAAMTPCMRLYAYLGQELAQRAGGIPDQQYAEWIETYSSSEFEGLAVSLESALDRLVDDEASAQAAYTQAMRCELEFFSAPLRMRKGSLK